MLPESERRKLEFNYAIAKKFKNRRKELGMSQDELAEKSGVARSTNSSMERINRQLSMDAFLALSYALGYEIILKEV